ncbi:unnamed protein product, partial [Allacma fusca]
ILVSSSGVFGERNTFNGDVKINGNFDLNETQDISDGVFGKMNLFNGNLKVNGPVTRTWGIFIEN